ncbi:hypothetical protein [Streptomyces phaeochromogenes]|uniref:hypothetical protein n=1 Tax=Streptomyces phaeochromogenes TaxID=1923 RepID=UPI00386DF8D9|nr:hypothetical protein OG277_49915 [Streptomyces phaeochromogenes]
MGTTRVVVIADVLHAQDEHVHFLARCKQAHYLLVVKNPQPSVFTELRSPHWSRATARHAARKTIYAITDLPSTHASPQQLGELARPHGGIENRLQFVRDTTFAEVVGRCWRTRLCAQPGTGERARRRRCAGGWKHCYKVHR